MTAAKLRELIDAMEREKYDTQEWHNARFKLHSCLRNHAQDFIRLMEAAEEIMKEHCRDVDDIRGDGCDICEALAAFKEKSC